MPDLPAITVVTPSLNQAQFLEQTIRSVLDQGYLALEYIILDGGSTDGSVEIIERFSDQLAYWTSAADDGQGAAIIDGWRRGTGEYITWINSDDILLPGSLEAVAQAARSRPDIVTGNEVGIDSTGNVISDRPKWRGPRWMYTRGLLQIGQPGTFYRRSKVEEVGFFDPRLHYSMEYDLHFRLLKADASLLYVRQRLAALRQHPDTKSNTGRNAFTLERRAIYRDAVSGPFRNNTLRENTVRALRYPYAGRYLLPRNWSYLRRSVK